MTPDIDTEDQIGITN